MTSDSPNTADIVERLEAWLGSPKETKKHPTVTLYTGKTARVIEVADLRATLAALKDATLAKVTKP
jgi:hypothetical protein